MGFNKKTKKPYRSKSNNKNGANPAVKKELLGLVIIAIGIIVFLSLVSYHPEDPVGFLDEENYYAVKNWLGAAGATIASPLFQWTLGYPILVLPLLMVLYGLYLMIQKPVKELTRITVLAVFWSFLFSILLALPEALSSFGNLSAFYPSGILGGLAAAYLVKLFGKFGAVFLMTVIVLALSALTFQIRLSTIPIGIYRGLQAGINFLKSRVNRPDKEKKRRKIEKKKTIDEEIQEELDGRAEPFYQPSLPTEDDLNAAEPLAGEPAESVPPPLEIVRNREEDDSSFQNEKTTEPTTLPDSSDTGQSAELGFEVQEAHQEKELNYDELIRDSLSKYQFPSSELLNEQKSDDLPLNEEELKVNARMLEEAIEQFGIKATVSRVVEGPVITLYEVKPAPGVKINQITNLADDLALAMRAKGIRMIAPIPGKAAIGIEIPNQNPSLVTFRSIVRSETFINFKGNLVLGVGKTISGEVYCADLTKMPHLLIAGATGSGKSVGINTIITSLLYRVPPSDLKFVMIDPKKLELSIYRKLKDHYLAICPDLDEDVITHPQNAIMVLRAVVNEMEERYDKLAAMGVREITHYNRKIAEYREKGETSEEYRKLPYIVVIIDELADLILTATREVEEPITRLAQMARAVGIHLIMATQRPSVDILTGLIKANFPARIAYQVATRPDSKVILDMYGAEKLIGNGDMLFFPPGKVKPIRIQNPLITTEEVERIIKHIRRQPKFPPYELKLMRARTKNNAADKLFERDELFEQAKEIVIRHQQGSVSLLQRKLKIGYARAARIVDELEEAGIVGPAIEGKAREVLISSYSPETE
ncbi:MAG: hypothetical protein Kow0037_09230 [Calditrichia bacterium]